MRKYNKELLVNRIKFIISVLCIIVVSWFGSMYWTTGKITLDFGQTYILDFDDNDDVEYIKKDLKVYDRNTFKSKSKDSYITIDFLNPIDIQDVYLDIDLGKNNKTANCQIFYCYDGQDFSDANSIRKKIKSGKNLISIDRGIYDKIRIDFVDRKGIKFDVNSLQVSDNFISNDFWWIFFLVTMSLSILSYIFFCGNTIENRAYSFISQKWNNISTRNKSLIGALILSLITLMIVIGKIEYNDQLMAYSDIGSDTLKQYIPQYNLIVNKIRSGTLSVWLPEVGYGYNIGHFFMFSPFLFIVFILGALFGTSSISVLVILYRVAVILLCVLFSFKYLEKFKFNYNVIAIGAYMYAFNGFAIIWGQHYVFFEYPLYTIIVFYLIEKHLQEKNKKFNFWLIIVSFFSMAFSVYMSYMIFLPAGIYAILRWICVNQKIKIMKLADSMFHLCLNIIIGFFGGLSIGLIYIKNILASGRTDGGESGLDKLLYRLDKSYLQDDFMGSIQRFISGNLSGIGSEHQGLHNYYEEPQIFFSIIFFVVFLQYLFTVQRASRNVKEVICKYIAVILVGLAIFNKGILFMLYAFSQDARRTVFALFPIFALMTVSVLNNIFYKKIISKIGIVLATVVTAVVLFYNKNQFASVEKDVLIAISMIALIISVVSLLYASIKKNSVSVRGCALALSIALFMNITTEMYVSVNREGIIGQDKLQETELKKDTRDAVEYIESIDNSYYRIDKTYSAWNEFTDSYFVNYNAISSYNAMLPGDMKEYNDLYMNPLLLSIRNYKPCFILSPYDIVQYSSLGLKYVLSTYKMSDKEHYNMIKKVGDVYIYENLCSNSFTTFFDDVVLESEFAKLEYNDRNIIQQKAMVIEDKDADEFKNRIKSTQQILDEYSCENLNDFLSVEDGDINQLYGTVIDSNKEIIISKDLARDNIHNLFMEMTVKSTTIGKVDIYFDTGDGYSKKGKYQMLCDGDICDIRYAIPNDVQRIKLDFALAPCEVLSFSINSTSESIKNNDNLSELIDDNSDAKINGKITCDRDGVLYIPLPYDSNWNIRIDNSEVEKFIANSGFCAINITEGNHEIEIIYESKELKIGFMLLCIAIIITIIYYKLSKNTLKDA